MKDAPTCLDCGYDLSGVTQGLTIDVRCPECNRAYISGEYKRPRRKLWLLLLGNVLVVLVVFAALPSDACGAPGLGYVGFAAWIVAALTLATSVQLLETHGYARRGSAWVFIRHLVLIAIALLFVSQGITVVKMMVGVR